MVRVLCLQLLKKQINGIFEILIILSGFAGINQINQLVDEVETEIFNREEKEIPSSLIGELVMDKLKDLEAVAYVRFASVYREFKDVNTFMSELKKMLDK